MENNNVRELRGQQIVLNSEIRLHKGFHHVPSQQTSEVYKVNSETLECNCPDFNFRLRTCKHVYAVAIQQKRIDKLKVVPFIPRNRYSQDWTAYNISQTTEKAEFLRLLSDLTRGFADDPQMNGRPALPLGDMLFSIIFKVYSQMSSRRFTTDLQDAHAKGFIDECPHYNSLNRYMEKESLTEHLQRLVEETSKPLASLESNFAVDSTGLGISNSVAWSRAKYKDQAMLKVKNWLKIHCCVGTHTNVITAVEITDKRGHDGAHFIPVMDTTRKNFTVKEVAADLAYSSMAHAAYTEMHGIENYIPFKENTSIDDYRSTEVWTRMFHYFNLHRATFVRRYMKRSNIETTFHMLKSKFGSTLKSRTFEAQKNEALCKVICHNIACLIHAMNEFGVEV